MLKQLTVTIALFATLLATANADVSIDGSMKKWHPLTIDLSGANNATDETFEQPHPFLDFRFDVSLTSPDGTKYTVPGFFAGDGKGNGSGDVWRARFSPDSIGSWQYTIHFITGTEVAVSDNPGVALPISGTTGTFTITDNADTDDGFLKYGRLEHTGKHYLKFRDGPYWIKGGIDSPENFFGYAGFDNTSDNPGGVNTGTLPNGLHEYPSHVADWQSGDPLFDNSATPDASKGIIGAVNYLASEGINSIYFLPMNLGGDGRDTHPFVSAGGTPYENTRYDISKLYQWNIVLNHMQNQGIAAHIVLGETEADNSAWLDNGELGTERKLFYREMVARFSYLLGVKWNISEESRFGAAKHKAFAQSIRSLDWASHPIAVHTYLNRPEEHYDAILADPDSVTSPYIDATSIQFSPANANKFVEQWREKTKANPWIIDMDEVGSAVVGLTSDNADSLRRSVLYPVYFSGGNIEWYFGYHPLPLGGDMRTEDFRTREAMYRYMRYAREMMVNELPFADMEPADSLHPENPAAGAQVFAKVGDAYAIYLHNASQPGTLQLAQGKYRQRWFNPRNGKFEGVERTVDNPSSPARVTLGTPPNTPGQDWVVLLNKVLPDNVQIPGQIPDQNPGQNPEPQNENSAENNPVEETDTNTTEPASENPVTETTTPDPDAETEIESVTQPNSVTQPVMQPVAQPEPDTQPETDTEQTTEPDVGPKFVVGGAVDPGLLLALLGALVGWTQRRSPKSRARSTSGA